MLVERLSKGVVEKVEAERGYGPQHYHFSGCYAEGGCPSALPIPPHHRHTGDVSLCDPALHWINNHALTHLDQLPLSSCQS